MRSGEPVDLLSLMDAESSATVMSDNTGGPSPVSGLKVPGLVSMYQQGADKRLGDCEDLFSEGQGAFEIWPDAIKNKIFIQAFGFAQAIRGCEYPLELSLTEARSAGFKQNFLDAIEEAHRQGEARKR